MVLKGIQVSGNFKLKKIKKKIKSKKKNNLRKTGLFYIFISIFCTSHIGYSVNLKKRKYFYFLNCFF